MPKKKELSFKIDKNGCHNCNSHKLNSSGYILVRINGKRFLAHRLIYEKNFGKIPKDILVRHSCDNPICINPGHLLLGTQTDNMNDKVDRNRQTKGTDVSTAKLNPIDILEIRKDKNSLHKELAKKFGVSRVTITKIKNYKSWAHI